MDIARPRKVSQGALFWVKFNKKVENAPEHHAALGQWMYPDMTDYVIIIKEDDSGVADLTLDVIPKKELYKYQHRKEIEQKVGKEIYEGGVKPQPVANIAAGYVGTDVELPEEPAGK